MATMTASPTPAGTMWAASVPVEIMAEALAVAAGARPMSAPCCSAPAVVSPVVSPALLDALVAAAEQHQQQLMAGRAAAVPEHLESIDQLQKLSAAGSTAANDWVDDMQEYHAHAECCSSSASCSDVSVPKHKQLPWLHQVKAPQQGAYVIEVQVGSPASSCCSSSSQEDSTAADIADAAAADKRMAKRKKRVSWGPDVILYDPALIKRQQSWRGRLDSWLQQRSAAQVVAAAAVFGGVAAAATTALCVGGRVSLRS